MTSLPVAEDYVALLGRIQKLETENRTIKRLGTLVLIAIAMLILMGQAGKSQAQSRALDADSLVIRDTSGRERIRFGISSDKKPFMFMDSGTLGLGGNLQIFDATNNSRIELGTNSSSPFLKMLDQKGSGIVAIGEEPLGGGYVTFSGSGGVPVYANLGFVGDVPQLVLTGHGGMTAIGAASVQLSDAEQFRADLGITDTLTPKTGASTKTSAASLILFGKDGKSLWQAP